MVVFESLGSDSCIWKKECELFISLTSDQNSQLSTNSCKTRKEKTIATTQLVDPGSVQILGEVEVILSDQKVATDKRKVTPAK